MRKLLKYVAGLLLLALLVYVLGPAETLDSLRGLEPIWLFGAATVWILNKVFKGFLWQWYLRSVGEEASLWESVRVILASEFAGLFLPSAGGSMTRPIYTTRLRRDASVSRAAAAVVLDQSNTLLSYSLIISVSVLVFRSTLDRTQTLVLVSIAGGLLLLYAVVYGTMTGKWGGRSGAGVLGSTLQRTRVGPYVEKAFRKLSESRESTATGFQNQRYVVTGLCMQLVINTAFAAALFYFLFRSVGVSVDPLPLLLIPAVANSLVIVPLTPQGMGLVEGFAIVLFGAIGVSSGPVVSVYLVYRGLYFLMSSLFGGASLLDTTVRQHRPN